MEDSRIAKYCSEICGGKCCRAYRDGREVGQCPKLDENNLCSIYKERFEDNKPFSFIFEDKSTLRIFKVDCGTMEQNLADGTVSQEIQDGCCLVHPELLNEVASED